MLGGKYWFIDFLMYGREKIKFFFVLILEYIFLKLFIVFDLLEFGINY